MRPRSGELNQQIIILNPMEVTDDAGGVETIFEEGETVWARVGYVGGSESERDYFRIADSTSIQVQIRPIYELDPDTDDIPVDDEGNLIFTVALTAEHRIRYREKDWDLISEPRIEELDDYLDFNCTYGVVTV